MAGVVATGAIVTGAGVAGVAVTGVAATGAAVLWLHFFENLGEGAQPSKSGECFRNGESAGHPLLDGVLCLKHRTIC